MIRSKPTSHGRAATQAKFFPRFEQVKSGIMYVKVSQSSGVNGAGPISGSFCGAPKDM